MRVITLVFLVFVTTSSPFSQGVRSWQGQIDDAFRQAGTGGAISLEGITDQFEAMAEGDATFIYWLAYTHYRAALLYLGGSDQFAASEHCNRGMEVLKSKAISDSEDLAMLGTLRTLNMRIAKVQNPTIGKQITDLFDEALILDPENMRAYLGKGRYYTKISRQPEHKPLAEKNLLKALELKSRYSRKMLVPYWGREEAFALIVEFYRQESRFEEAREYCSLGSAEFPDSEMISDVCSGLADD